MSNNINKKDALHDRLPEIFNSRNNANWNAIVEAIGGEDDETAKLIEAVRQQFFVKTAGKPYLDRLGANVNVNRPRFVGMDDQTFRRYIPVLAYQPKQVKLILDILLDIFFFKDSTTSFMESTISENFSLRDGWELKVLVDNDPEKQELIIFEAQDFSDIQNVTADEIVSVINKQAQSFYAVKFEDSVRRQTFIRLFTRTIGSKGSLEIVGGRSNIAFRFDKSFNENAGFTTNTTWEFTKIGDEVSMRYAAGNNPQVENVQPGDYVVLDLPGNQGSFEVERVDLATQSIIYKDLFATEGQIQQTSNEDVQFLLQYKAAVHQQSRRAIVWEVAPGEITVELPTSPPVVRRNRRGASHINGEESVMVSRVSDTSIEIQDASEWPDSGYFLLIPRQEIKTRHLTPQEDEETTYRFNGRLINKETLFKYESKNGNILEGIEPGLPQESKIFSYDIDTISRTNNVMTITTTAPHEYTVGMNISIQDAVITTGMVGSSANGSFKITNVVDNLTFQVESYGDNGTATGGHTRGEKIGLADSGSIVVLHTSTLKPDTPGPYIWDPNADFVLSSLTTQLEAEIKAGDTARGIEVAPNDILDQQGLLVFSFGTENQEGPVRYLFKPSDNTIAIDPSYVFQKNHEVGSSVTMLRRRGPHILSISGDEFPAYVTDTSAAREVLFELMQRVKSVGIFIDFLVRYPQQIYATLDVYNSGVLPGDGPR